jgi:hypothetical protein
VVDWLELGGGLSVDEVRWVHCVQALKLDFTVLHCISILCTNIILGKYA